MPPPLDHLDDIDWASGTHAYGPASDVPGQLRALLSPDALAREHAPWELFGNIHHQGTVYPATATAIPFLYELLADPATPHREGVAALLGAIAAGRTYFERTSSYWQEWSARRGLTLDEAERESVAVMAEIHRACSKQLLLLLPYLDRATDLREVIGRALGHYPEHASTSLPALERALERALAIEDGSSDEGWARDALEESIRMLRDAAPGL